MAGASINEGKGGGPAQVSLGLQEGARASVILVYNNVDPLQPPPRTWPSSSSRPNSSSSRTAPAAIEPTVSAGGAATNALVGGGRSGEAAAGPEGWATSSCCIVVLALDVDVASGVLEAVVLVVVVGGTGGRRCCCCCCCEVGGGRGGHGCKGEAGRRESGRKGGLREGQGRGWGVQAAILLLAVGWRRSGVCWCPGRGMPGVGQARALVWTAYPLRVRPDSTDGGFCALPSTISHRSRLPRDSNTHLLLAAAPGWWPVVGSRSARSAAPVLLSLLPAVLPVVLLALRLATGGSFAAAFRHRRSSTPASACVGWATKCVALHSKSSVDGCGTWGAAAAPPA